MKTLIRVLLLTTIVLAGTTAYYGQALMRERARAGAHIAHSSDARAAPSSRVDQALVTSNQSATTGSPETDSSAQPATAVVADQPGDRAPQCPDPDALASAQGISRRYRNPAEYPALRIESRQALSRYWASVSAAIRIPDTELQHFLDQMEEGSFRIAHREMECLADPECHCNGKAVLDSLREERRQLIHATLGPRWTPGYEAYVYATQERVLLSAAQEKLADEHQLDGEKVNTVALALAEVRRAFIAEAASRGQRIQASAAGGFGIQDLEGDQPPQIFAPPDWDLTDQFNQRLDQVAARHLTPPQLTAFRALRKKRLDNARALEQHMR